LLIKWGALPPTSTDRTYTFSGPSFSSIFSCLATIHTNSTNNVYFKYISTWNISTTGFTYIMGGVPSDFIAIGLSAS
jgi:hypothetical protein